MLSATAVGDSLAEARDAGLRAGRDASSCPAGSTAPTSRCARRAARSAWTPDAPTLDQVRDGAAEFAVTGDDGRGRGTSSTGRKQASLRRLRADIAVAVVVLGGAVLIARRLAGGKHTTAGTRTPTPTASGHDQGRVAHRPSAARTVPRCAGRLRCWSTRRVCPRATDGESFCTTVDAVPSAFLAAVRRAYPRVVVDSAETNLLRPTAPEPPRGIWSRTFSGHERRTRITLGREPGRTGRQRRSAARAGRRHRRLRPGAASPVHRAGRGRADRPARVSRRGRCSRS